MSAPAAGKPGRTGTIASLNVSRKKGQIKTPVPEVELVAGEGFAEDAHRGFAHRQVSLLMIESIEEQRDRLGERAKGIIEPGAFAENITTRGLDLLSVKAGDELAAGESVRLRVTQIGKECHTHCAVYHLTGDCIMPALGIFCEVLAGGTLRVGDRIERL
jgi:molybdopterin adenylyltransferase